MTLSFLIWSTVIAALISFWWQGDRVKSIAMTHVYRYFKEQKLQLLDQTMVLKGVWPVRDSEGSLRLRRRYSFEFTSTGEVRSQGTVELLGARLGQLHLDPHLIPEDDDRSLH
ncbi:MAG: DUF3301 domain-containing protein [Gammaproteobacteria bacterium]|nr:DUF3301 domain-containing protein [Gammaproteobacteria bacterium]MBT6482653.1 DUF3301 domain-containing protein [Gammaproteobacteria bacterium]MBT7226204.1 DUF3301 domain-containing protein [Gammaproteobacteria bacterium]